MKEEGENHHDVQLEDVKETPHRSMASFCSLQKTLFHLAWSLAH